MKKLCVLLMLVFTLFGCSDTVSEKKENQVISDYSKFLYKVTSPEGNYAYVLGTYHANKQEIKKLDKVTQNAFEDAEALAIEIDLGLIETAQYQNLSKINPVSRELNEEELKELASSLKQYTGMPNNYEEYNLGTISLLASQDVIDDLGYHTNNAIDLYLFHQANQIDKKVLTFETNKEQREMIKEVGLQCKDYILAELKEKDKITDVSKKCIKAYRKGDVKELEKLFADDGVVDTTDEKLLKQKEFSDDLMIYQRNDKMTEKLKEMMNDGQKVFVAVGAGHVIGERGILQQLEEQGYQVERLAK